ncbi:MAG: DUF4279 domain-containing protein [Pseudomonadota bacterium]
MAEVDYTRVSFRLFAEDLDPEAVSGLLGVEPTRSWRRGERRKVSRLPYKSGAWFLDIERREPGDLDAQLSELFRRLPSDLETWNRLGARVDRSIFCGLFMEETNCGLSIRPSTLQGSAHLGAPLQLDVYAPTEDDD